MKLLKLLLPGLILFIGCSGANGQILVNRNDSIWLETDTVAKIVLPEYRGVIQWQSKTADYDWTTIEGQTGDTIVVDAGAEVQYRAMITEGGCDPVYSDTLAINPYVMKGVVRLPEGFDASHIMVYSLTGRTPLDQLHSFIVKTKTILIVIDTLLNKPLYYAFPGTDEKQTFEMNARETALYFCLSAFPHAVRAEMADHISGLKTLIYELPEVKTLEEKIYESIQLKGYLDFDFITPYLGLALEMILSECDFEEVHVSDSVSSAPAFHAFGLKSAESQNSSNSGYPYWDGKYHGWFKVEYSEPTGYRDGFNPSTGIYYMTRNFYNSTPCFIGVKMGKVNESGNDVYLIGDYIGFLEPYYPPNLSVSGMYGVISQFAESTWDLINEGFMDGFAQTDAFSSSQPFRFELKAGEKDAFVFLNAYHDEQLAALNVAYVFLPIIGEFLPGKNAAQRFLNYLLNTANDGLRNYVVWWDEKQYPKIVEHMLNELKPFLIQEGLFYFWNEDVFNVIGDHVLAGWSYVYTAISTLSNVLTMYSSLKNNFGCFIPVQFDMPMIYPPQISTREVTEITAYSATCGGNILSDGGKDILTSGICWSTSPIPTIADFKTTDGTKNFSFRSSMTNLVPGTKYYVRAYATNITGTVYGSIKSFTATAGASAGTFKDPRDNKVYQTVRIGNQVWLAENLAWLPAVSPPSEDSSTDPVYYVYGYDGTDVSAASSSENCSTYGALYNWPAALNACPQGWHLPSDLEWKQLEGYLGLPIDEFDNAGFRGGEEGKQLKSPTGWTDDVSGTNSSGFSAIPAGYRFSEFEWMGIGLAWWSSSPASEENAWDRGLNNQTNKIDRYAYGKNSGFSVRCLKDLASATTPSITTKSMTEITQNSAMGGGEISSDGGSIVIARGICWNTTGTPDVQDPKTADGAGTGVFKSNMTGLSVGTKYYVRAYAVNSKGVSYGEEMSFTAGTDATKGTFVDDRDGTEYNWVKIGDQVWMAENLAYLPAVSGPSTGSMTEPFVYVYGYDASDVSAAKATSGYTTYGGLYNWTAAMTACPPGWHLPGDAEWTTLSDYLINNGYGYQGSGEDIAKSLASTSNWLSGGTPGSPGMDPASNNLSGFAGLPGGARYTYPNGHFKNLTGIGIWWSSDSYTADIAWFRSLTYGGTSLNRGNSVAKDLGFSVRCVKNIN